jgi:predicted secreted protein
MTDKSSLSRRHFISVSPLVAAALATDSADAKEYPIPSPNYAIPESGFHGRDENKRDWSGDPRSRKVVFLSHCVLNQNARIVRAADFPAMLEPLIDYLQKRQVGLIQMPCPEIYCLGLGRRDVRVGLESPAGRQRLERLIDDVVFTIREYLFQGFEIVGILGKEGSPSCGVTRTWLDNREQDGHGVWIRELKKRLVAEKLDIPVPGVADHKQDETIRWLEERLK